jgi:hypothetical protein
MYSITLFKGFTASIGNSIIYANDDIQPAYLIPFILFKSYEHSTSLSNENNAQIFFNLSSRNIKNVHLFTSFFIDEINFGYFWDEEKHSNWVGGKLGCKIFNFPLNNLFLSAEYTRTNPMVYKHYFPTATFESNKYNMGHYLRDNAQELYLALTYKPLTRLWIQLHYSHAEKGPDYPDIRNDPDYSSAGKKFLNAVEWENRQIGLSAEFELIHDTFIRLSFLNQEIFAKDKATMNKYTAPYYQGRTNTWQLSFNYGF